MFPLACLSPSLRFQSERRFHDYRFSQNFHPSRARFTISLSFSSRKISQNTRTSADEDIKYIYILEFREEWPHRYKTHPFLTNASSLFAKNPRNRFPKSLPSQKKKTLREISCLFLSLFGLRRQARLAWKSDLEEPRRLRRTIKWPPCVA